MFTSRAEYRLLLRADNADERLTPLGIRLGLVGPERVRAFEERAAILREARRLSRTVSVSPTEAQRAGLKVNQDGVRRTALDLLAYPGIGLAEVRRLWPELGRLPTFALEQLEVEALYAGYLDRQQADIVAFRKEEGLAIPPGLDYGAVPGLSSEARQKLLAVRPCTLGQAARIDGVTPAAIATLMTHLKRPAVARSA
jgi:tRNA uridine 5-carboxymethylaminomethyl modification enzyme